MQSFVPLQDGAYQYLLDAIIREELEIDTVYSFNAISEKLNMSRTPVRDAVRRLEQEGYVDILPSRGFVVRTLTREEIISLYQTRCAVEGYCCRVLASLYQRGQARETVSALRDSLDQQAELMKREFSPREYMLLDEEFHNIIIQALGNHNFNLIIERLNGRIGQFRMQSLTQGGRAELTFSEHSSIVEAIVSGDEEASYQAMKAHLDTPLKSNLSAVDGANLL